MLDATNVLIGLIVLIIAVVSNIAVMARWSGRVDTLQESSLSQQDALSRVWDQRFSEVQREIERARDRLHKVEGEQQRLRGLVQWMERAQQRDAED